MKPFDTVKMSCVSVRYYNSDYNEEQYCKNSHKGFLRTFHVACMLDLDTILSKSVEFIDKINNEDKLPFICYCKINPEGYKLIKLIHTKMVLIEKTKFSNYCSFTGFKINT